MGGLRDAVVDDHARNNFDSKKLPSKRQDIGLHSLPPLGDGKSAVGLTVRARCNAMAVVVCEE